MNYGSIAKRYATALISVAEEQGKVDEYFAQLSSIRRLLAEHPALQDALSSPVVAPSKKKNIFSKLAPKLGTSPIIGNLIHVLIDNKRISEINLIELLYRDLADERKGRIRVQVTSATALGSHEAKLKTILEKALKQEVIFETKVDPQLLGGLVVQVKDRIFDASLKGELERLRETLIIEAVA